MESANKSDAWHARLPVGWRTCLWGVATAAFVISIGSVACRDRKNAQARVQGYEENGVVWGWGDVRLATPSATTGIFLDRLPETTPSGQKFKLVGADTATGSTTDLFYADWHPLLDPPVPVVFVSQFYVQERGGAAGTMDVYVKIKKPGRTWPEAFTLSVGTADVRNRQVSRIPVSLVDGLRLSRLLSGDQRGSVVFHYADLPRDLPGGPGGMPPGQRLSAEGFNPVTQDGQRVWGLPAGMQGKLTFVSRSLQAKPAEHPRLCQDHFFAAARSASNQVNKACKLTLAPAESDSGWLTCSLLVQIENPFAPADKTCRVIGSFLDENDESDQLTAVVVQVGASQ